MPLPRPPSYEESYASLVAEGMSLLPRLAPLWTDHNAHDPGITLLELLAWLTEGDLYRLGRTSASLQRALLTLAGAAPRPALVAETVLLFQLRSGAAVALPPCLQVSGGGLVFQTIEPLQVRPARLVALLAGDPAAPEPLPLGTLATGPALPTFGPSPGPGHALYVGFDRALEPGAISLYFWRGADGEDRLTRARLLEEWEAARAEAALCGADTSSPADWRLHYAARTVWEYHTGGGDWAPLAELEDETRALSLSGAIRFSVPAAPLHSPGGVGGSEQLQTYFVRCRLASGGYDCPPTISLLAVNAVVARHAADAPSASLGRSDGRAGQRFALPLGPALPGSIRLSVELDGVDDGPWQERDLARAGPHERAFMLDREDGALCFGDGRHGRVPMAGAMLRIDYRIGGGAVGNLPAGSLGDALAGAHNEALLPGWSGLRSQLELRQPAPALGGADAEPLEEARRRLLERLQTPQRAVTLGDYTALALAAPGLPVARAYAVADYHPAYPCLPAPGSITLVLLPRCPERLPQPSPELLRAIRRYLERRRTLGDELHLVGPRYSLVAVRARLVAPSGDRGRLVREAHAALDSFLSPLRGGPEGTGWPVGRPVYRSEVLALLGRLPGVAYVEQLELLSPGEPAAAEGAEQNDGGCGGCGCGVDAGARCGNLALCPDGLPAPGRHEIAVVTAGASPDRRHTAKGARP